MDNSALSITTYAENANYKKKGDIDPPELLLSEELYAPIVLNCASNWHLNLGDDARPATLLLSRRKVRFLINHCLSQQT